MAIANREVLLDLLEDDHQDEVMLVALEWIARGREDDNGKKIWCANGMYRKWGC